MIKFIVKQEELPYDLRKIYISKKTFLFTITLVNNFFKSLNVATGIDFKAHPSQTMKIDLRKRNHCIVVLPQPPIFYPIPYLIKKRNT